MKHIFISYSQDTDQDFVENLITRLDAVGLPTWYDQKIPVGDEWRTAIDTAINDAFAFIVVMTPEASIAPYVTYEWAYARGRGIKIIPILLREAKLHKRLGAFQYLDFTSKQRPWSQLVDELKTAQQTAITQAVLHASWYSLFSTLDVLHADQEKQGGQSPLLAQSTEKQQLPASPPHLENVSASDSIEMRSLLSSLTMKNNPVIAALIEAQNNEKGDRKTRMIASLTLEIIKNHAAITSLTDVSPSP